VYFFHLSRIAGTRENELVYLHKGTGAQDSYWLKMVWFDRPWFGDWQLFIIFKNVPLIFYFKENVLSQLLSAKILLTWK
jgi:hypothetical protein